MRILALSDLHLELGDIPLVEDGRRVDEGVDLVVLAGDVMNGLGGPAWARWAFPAKKIVMVAGNHEFYDQDFYDGVELLRQQAGDLGIHFLENESVEIDGLRILGCSLWTDYCLHGAERQQQRMEWSERRMTDFGRIRSAGARLSAKAVLLRHKESVAWLDRELVSGDGRRTVVVTHHAPHPNSVPDDNPMAGDSYGPAYASDLSHLLGRSRLWIHGHVHDVLDYSVRGTRVVCNPRGYPSPNGDALSGWDPCFSVEV